MGRGGVGGEAGQASLGEVQAAGKGGDCSRSPVAQQILVTRPECAMSSAAERQTGGSAESASHPIPGWLGPDSTLKRLLTAVPLFFHFHSSLLRC